MYKFLTSKKGFSLTELMIVVVVMGILLAIAVPTYGAVTKSGNKKVCNAQQVQLQSEVKNWCLLNNFNGDYNYKITSDGETAKLEPYILSISEGDCGWLLQEVHKGKVAPCPSGGTYYIKVIPKPGGVPDAEVFCDCEDHNTEGKVADTTAPPVNAISE